MAKVKKLPGLGFIGFVLQVWGVGFRRFRVSVSGPGLRSLKDLVMTERLGT